MLERLRESGNDVPVVIVTAHGSIPDAVQAMKLGAIDFLTKPLNPEPLRQVVGGSDPAAFRTARGTGTGTGLRRRRRAGEPRRPSSRLPPPSSTSPRSNGP